MNKSGAPRIPPTFIFGISILGLAVQPLAVLDASDRSEQVAPGMRIADVEGRFSFVVPESGYLLHRSETVGGGIEVRLKPSDELLTIGNGDYVVRVFSGKEAPPPGLSLDNALQAVFDTISATFGIHIQLLQKEARSFQGQDAVYVEWLALGQYQQIAENIKEANRSYQYASDLFFHEADLYFISRSNPMPMSFDPANPTVWVSGGVDDQTREQLERFLKGFSFEIAPRE